MTCRRLDKGNGLPEHLQNSLSTLPLKLKTTQVRNCFQIVGLKGSLDQEDNSTVSEDITKNIDGGYPEFGFAGASTGDSGRRYEFAPGKT